MIYVTRQGALIVALRPGDEDLPSFAYPGSPYQFSQVPPPPLPPTKVAGAACRGRTSPLKGRAVAAASRAKQAASMTNRIWGASEFRKGLARDERHTAQYE